MGLYRKIRSSVLKRYLALRRCTWLLAHHRGGCFLLNAGEKTDRLVYLRDNEHEQIERLCTWVERHGPTRFLDIGANFGLYSVILGRRFPNLQIWGFEPVPELNLQFRANVLINGLNNVRAVDMAVSDAPGTAVFERERGGHAGLSRMKTEQTPPRGRWEEIVVQTASIDGMLDCRGERLAIKVDVEGHECRVLQGMERLLDCNDCYLQVEVFPGREANRIFIMERLSTLGYRLTAQIGKDYIFERLATALPRVQPTAA